MSPLTVNGHSIDPSNLNGVESGSSDASNSNYILVQGHRQFDADDFQQLADHNVTVQEYVGADCYLCRFEPSDFGPVQRLSQVQNVTVYPNRAVIHPRVYERTEDRQNVAISLHKNADLTANQVLDQINRIAEAEVIDVSEGLIRVNIDTKHLGAIAEIDSVRSITDVRSVNLHTVVASKILKVPEKPTSVNYSGKGEVIAVADTGLDKGKVDDVHAAFTGRVKAVVAFPPRDPDKTADSTVDVGPSAGHGTHVAGCALGSYDPDSGDDMKSIRGPATKSELFVQALKLGFGQPTPQLRDLLTQPYDQTNNATAKVRNCSWDSGDNKFRQYEYGDDNARLIDEVMFNHKNILACWSAGNNGTATTQSGSQQIGGEPAAKNCITVGATYSARPTDDDLKYVPGEKPGNPYNIPDFSNRGPTLEKRLKPDVVAPGVTILSARSRVLDTARSDFIDNEYGNSPDKTFCFMVGTSQAAPLVAGCAAVLREALLANQKEGAPEPSGALVKALLINGAVDLEGGTAKIWKLPEKKWVNFPITKAPNPVQGYGRVDLERSLKPILEKPDKPTYLDVRDSVNGGETVAEADIPASPNTLHVTLAYTDPPGKELQNKISLFVNGTDDVLYGPNSPSDMGYTSPPPVYTQNNVSKIVIKNLPPGKAKLQVNRDLGPGQATADYALVWWVEV